LTDPPTLICIKHNGDEEPEKKNNHDVSTYTAQPTQDNKGSATHQESKLCPNVRAIQDVRQTLQLGHFYRTSNRQYIGIVRQLRLLKFVTIRPTCLKVHEK
jgi:hypothetical protein